MKIGPNQVHMARFELILCQNPSHKVWDASGMTPAAPGAPWGPKGAQGAPPPRGAPRGFPLKIQKSRDSGKSRKIREFPYIPYSCGVATTWPITLGVTFFRCVLVAMPPLYALHIIIICQWDGGG